jgi:beta-galactosidase
LFLNGKSLGKQKKGQYEYRLRWEDVKYEPGELKVVAYKAGKPWAEDVVKTAGAPEKMSLSADRPTLRADGEDLSFVTVRVQDKNGEMVPQAKPALHFEVSGPGQLVATDNGDPTDHTSFHSVDRKAFNGLALVILRAKPGTEGPITLQVTGAGLSPAEIAVKAVH